MGVVHYYIAQGNSQNPRFWPDVVFMGVNMSVLCKFYVLGYNIKRVKRSCAFVVEVGCSRIMGKVGTSALVV